MCLFILKTTGKVCLTFLSGLKMKKQDVINFFGSQKETAVALGITRQAVNQWPELLPKSTKLKVLGTIVLSGRTIPAIFMKAG